MCSINQFSIIADFLKLYKQYFIDLLKLENGISFNDTFSKVISAINSKKFTSIFIELIKDIVNQNELHIAIDRKAIKNARNKINNGKVPYIPSWFFYDISLSIEQRKVDNKSNKITAISDLLDWIDVKGKVITIDTIVLKRKQLIKLVMKKAAYILKVEDKKKDLKDDIKTYFDLKIKNDSSNIDILETPYEKEHSGIKKKNLL